MLPEEAREKLNKIIEDLEEQYDETTLEEVDGAVRASREALINDIQKAVPYLSKNEQESVTNLYMLFHSIVVAGNLPTQLAGISDTVFRIGLGALIQCTEERVKSGQALERMVHGTDKQDKS